MAAKKAHSGRSVSMVAKKSRPDLSQLASLGYQINQTGAITDTTIRELQGIRAFQVYREMADHSAVIGACLLAIEMLIRKVKWSVTPGDASAEEAQHAEIIESMLDDMSSSWPDTIAEILSMLVYGFCYMEQVYKIRRGPDERDGRYRSRFKDGVVAWRKWVPVPQETLSAWVWDQDGGIQGMTQRSPNDYKERTIPIDKALLFRTKSARNNPQGRSMLLNAFFPWQFVKRTMEFEGIGLERDLAGLPMALVPPEYLSADAGPEEKAMLNSIKDLVTSVRQNAQAGIVFPMAFDDENNPMFEFKLLATGGMKQFDTNKIIERYERRMAMSLLNDVILMGHERVGSLALSRDKTTLLGRALAAILQSISAVINRHAIPRLYELNGWNQEVLCTMVPGDVENADIKNLGTYVANLVRVGAITPDPGLESAMREAGGLPMVDPAYVLGPGELPTSPDNPHADAAEEDAADAEDDGEDDTSDTPDPEPAADKPKKPKGKKTLSGDGPGGSLASLAEAAEARRTAKRQRRKAA